MDLEKSQVVKENYVFDNIPFETDTWNANVSFWLVQLIKLTCGVTQNLPKIKHFSKF